MNAIARLARLFKKKRPDTLGTPSLSGLVFRFRFTLPKTLAIQSDEHYIDFSYPDETRHLILAASGDSTQLKNAKQIVLKGGPFETEEQALEAGERAKRALMLSLTRMRIGASFGLDEPRSVLTQYGRKYFEQQIGGRVLQDLPQVVVFDDNIPTRFANLNMSPVIGRSSDRVKSLFLSALELAPEFSEREQLALELYGAAFFEPSVRSRFLALMIAVETLLEPKERSANAVEMVESFIQQVQRSTMLSRSERDSLCGTLKWLKRESIKRTGRDLASERLAGRQYLGMSADAFFKLCYDVRSEIVHTGAARMGGVDIGGLAPELESFVADLICSRFEGLAEYP